MERFTLTLYLDSPLLLGGWMPGEVDNGGMLRGSSVRGLLHTFARALLGPMLGFDPRATREAERRLLGSAGGDEGGGGATYRVVDVTRGRMRVVGNQQILPHRRFGGFARNAFAQEQTRRLRFTVRAAAAARDPLLTDALLGVAWTAFSLGSLGGRCRRGFGSMSIVTITRNGEGRWKPPAFGLVDDRSPDSVREAIETGLEQAREHVRQWLAQHNFKAEATPGTDYFFSLGSDGTNRAEVRIASRSLGVDWGDFIEALMTSCHQGLQSHEDYSDAFGAAAPRQGSPVWFRVFRIRGGLLSIVTLPARFPSNGRLSPSLTDILGANLFGSRTPIPIA